MVDGPAAASLGVLARDRWRALGAERLPPMGASSGRSLARDITPDLTDVDVAISRTMPGSDDRAGRARVRGAVPRFDRRGQRTIYIENQYFTNSTLADALAARLAEPDGPEVVIVVPRDSHGWLEQKTIGAIRDNLFRRLIASDPSQAAAARRAGRLARARPPDLRPLEGHDRRRRVGADRVGQLLAPLDGHGHRMRPRRRGARRSRCAGRHSPDSRSPDRRAPRLGGRRGRPGHRACRIARARFSTRTSGADHTLARIELPPNQLRPPSEAVRLAVDPDEPVGFRRSVDQLVPAVDATIAPSLAANLDRAGRRRRDVVGGSRRRGVGFVSGWFRPPELSLAIGVGMFVMGGLALIPLEVLAIASGVVLRRARRWRSSRWPDRSPRRSSAISPVASIGTIKLSRWMSRRSYRSGSAARRARRGRRRRPSLSHRSRAPARSTCSAGPPASRSAATSQGP